MNKEQLEKMFEEMYTWRDKHNMKQFIFETVIPKVLKSVIYRTERIPSNNIDYLKWYTDCQDIIKQKAKELYNITL